MPLADLGASRQDRRRGHYRASGSDRRPTARGGGVGVDLRLHFVGDHRRVAAWASHVSGRAGFRMAGPDSSSISHPNRRDRDPRRLVDVASSVGELRAAVSVFVVLELHLPRHHLPRVVQPSTDKARHTEALPRRRVSLGAGTVPHRDDGARPEHPQRSSRPVAPRRRNGGARRSVLSLAPTHLRRASIDK